ncbi:MAG: beta-N-acetylhexosaminidase [Armatimonadetes bacterium]|nr:beta-N-acetylhexosaminidase [Armatimonadota bacterium]
MLLLSLLFITCLTVLSLSARADSSADEVQVGELSAAFSPDKGLSLTFRGVPIIHESSLWVVSPGWTNVYYGFGRSRSLDTSVQEIEGGGRRILVEETRSDWMNLRYEVSLFPGSRVEIGLAYRWLQDKEASMEYCIGLFSAAPLAGATYEGETRSGEKVSGNVPFEAVSADPFQATLIRDFRRIAFRTRLGTLALESEGDRSDPVFFDGRKNTTGWGNAHPVFWCGFLGSPVQKGEWRTRRLILKLEGAKAAPKAAPSPRLKASQVIIEREDARVPATGPVRIIPTPRKMDMAEGVFRVDAKTRIVAGDRAEATDLRAAEALQRELRDIFGRFVPIIRAKSVKSARHIIVLGELNRNNLSEPLCEKSKVSVPDKEEGYALAVTPQWVVVAGRDRPGTYWGAQSLIQMLGFDEAGRIVIPSARIEDYPALRYRGVHLIPDRDSLAVHGKMIERILARYKINQIVLECEYAKWDSHPEIHQPWAISKEDLKKLAEIAREHFMEVNPLIQSLGHCEWIFKGGQNLDIAEDKNNPYAYCPSHPRSYDFIFSAMDEAVELFGHPRFMHIGHDEVSMIGQFPSPDCKKCRGKSEGDLFIQDTLKLYEHLKAKGVKTMMWGDMLLAIGEAPDAYNAKTLEEAQRRRDALPKDIAIADWHYAAAREYPNVAILQREGFEVIGCTWDSHENILWFARAVAKEKARGLLQTTWAGYYGVKDEIKNALHQISAYIVAADCAWNPASPAIASAAPYNADDLYMQQWNTCPLDRRPKAGFTVDLSAFGTRPLKDDIEGSGWLGYGPEQDLRNLPAGNTRLGQIAFRIAPQSVMLTSPLLPALPDEVTGIPIGTAASAFHFLMTCGWPVAEGTEVGAITVYYLDGTQERIPLLYGRNIASWRDFAGGREAPVVWDGKTPGGTRAAVRAYAWQNPHPEKVVSHMDFSAAPTAAAPALLAVTGMTGR